MHSHTHSPAYPSATDVGQAPDPTWHYVIISLQHDEPSLRSYRIVDGTVTEEDITIAPREVGRRARAGLMVRFLVGRGPEADHEGRAIAAGPGCIGAVPARKDHPVRKYVIIGVQGSGKGPRPRCWRGTSTSST